MNINKSKYKQCNIYKMYFNNRNYTNENVRNKTVNIKITNALQPVDLALTGRNRVEIKKKNTRNFQ